MLLVAEIYADVVNVVIHVARVDVAGAEGLPLHLYEAGSGVSAGFWRDSHGADD